MCQSIGSLVCCVCVCVCVCVCGCGCVYVYMSNQSNSKKTHYTSDLSKFYTLLHTQQGILGTKVPRFDMYTSIISLRETTHQMWHYHSFSK